ncbi:MAG: macro domain-containing protein [Nitrospirae bacterium]|nr:macro domain-containing protein [Nitrospirota bacterium]
MDIQVHQGSLLDVEADAIVNAANSIGVMGGGVAGVIRRAAGEQVEQEAVKKGPTPVGKAVVTTAGRLKFRGIVHAPTMERPAMLIPARNVGRATTAALRAADSAGYASLAIPGMGTGVGGVSAEEAAQEMIAAIKAFKATSLRTVFLVDVRADMVAAWKHPLQPT